MAKEILWQPIVNCGLHCGDIPQYFLDHYSFGQGFATEDICKKWIDSNRDMFDEGTIIIPMAFCIANGEVISII